VVIVFNAVRAAPSASTRSFIWINQRLTGDILLSWKECLSKWSLSLWIMTFPYMALPFTGKTAEFRIAQLHAEHTCNHSHVSTGTSMPRTSAISVCFTRWRIKNCVCYCNRSILICTMEKHKYLSQLREIDE
jgi:hypothetical protein